MCREGTLAIECPYIDNYTSTQNQPTLPVDTQQTSSAGPTLFPAANPIL